MNARQAPAFNVSRDVRISKAQAALRLAYGDWNSDGLKGNWIPSAHRVLSLITINRYANLAKRECCHKCGHGRLYHKNRDK
jgi:hypothetical protein